MPRPVSQPLQPIASSKAKNPKVQRNPLRLPWFELSGMAIAASCLAGLGVQAGVSAAPPEPELQLGVVQRFGTKPTDELTLQAPAGDRLTITFTTGPIRQTLSTTKVKMDVVMQPLPEPQVNERVVLSTHRSFESAEDSAAKWQAQGIEVEVAQPERWQVWAKRDVYSSPLLRRLLLQSLQDQGNATAYIDSQVLSQVPKASFIVDGYRYTRDQLQVSSSSSLVQVTPGSKEKNKTPEQIAKEQQTSRLYAGTIRLQPNSYGTYTLVNQVPIETYLRGVVPHEIGAGAPQPAVEAQAILARTYALRNLRRFAIDGYELCADTQCQVYWGLTGTVPEADRAIAATRGLVLTYQNELVDALYSSTTGGVTAPFSDVWNGAPRPYLRAVIDSAANIWDLSQRSLANEQNFRAFITQRKGFNEEGWDMFRWREEGSLARLTTDLKQYLQSNKHPLADFTAIQQLQVTERSPAGRVLKMVAQTDRGAIELEKDDILNAFYPPNSTLFYLDPIYGANKVLKGYAFVGGGLGHGVGLSQTGSYRLGKLGWTNQKILSFYYPGTQIQPISQALTFWRIPSPQTAPRS
ncbi:SpoIID/LytB domain-containing protein [Trichocoleus sp. FACHB-591]|uniref:SpoIID/LytB domain-containing protein n=1 Tax=Trichocoleus sp. FACHB-591 TaxID=2692872 RepID=UPI001F5548EE|nr:SpoIID/LytB domain-containing protein [Trichocoleus sp. FACHB-591]